MNFIEFTEWYEKKYGEVSKEEVLVAWRESGFAPSKATGNAQGLLFVSPKRILKDILNFDVETSDIIFKRPSITLENTPSEETICCKPAKALYDTLDDYLDWKSHQTGEAEKNIKFITVVGTSGKGKTTFARRFIDLPYTGNYDRIVNDCKNSNRRYRVRCTKFDTLRDDPETQLALLLLFEAFKHSTGNYNLQNYITEFRRHFEKITLADVLELITNTFRGESDLQQRLLIINLDETNSLLTSNGGKEFFGHLLRLLRDASESFTLLTILSGTHSVDLFEQVKISQSKFVDIELSLIPLEASKQIVLGMTPTAFEIAPYLEYILILCGGVGRYIEILIIQMSILGSFKMDGTSIKGFKLDSYEYFLRELQTPQNVEILLERLTTSVLEHYPDVFNKYEDCIELLSCYTLFRWPVKRKTVINQYSIGDLEKYGLVFLVPDASISQKYFCVIPFITLYWAIKYSNQNVEIPFLKNIKSYFSPEESENNSLHIMMAKLWELVQKNKLVADRTGLCTIMLSEILPLRVGQDDLEIKFRPIFSRSHMLLSVVCGIFSIIIFLNHIKGL